MGHWQWIASAATWVAIAGATQRHSATFSILTLFSAMCYAWGRVAETGWGGPPLVAADLFGFAALLSVGGPGVVNIIARMGRRFALAWGSGRGVGNSDRVSQKDQKPMDVPYPSQIDGSRHDARGD